MRKFPLLGVLPRLIADPTGLFVEAMRDEEEVVPLPIGPVTAFFVHHPDHLRHIMLDNQKNYSKGPLFQRADIMIGNGLVVNHGDSWLRQRRMMQPPFSAARVASIVPVVVDAAKERIDAWRPESGPMEMWGAMSSYTMSALLRAFFGMQVDDVLIARIDKAFDVLGRHLALRAPTFFLPEWFPLPGRRKALAARAELDRIIADMVDSRRKKGKEGNDLLGLLLAARDDAGRPMTDEQLSDEVKTSIFGGYDSTATGLAWTWHILATQPEAARQVHEEILRVMPEGDPTFEQIDQLKVLGRVFQETLRLYPPFSFHPRTALKDDVIGTRRIPAGSMLLYCNYATNRHPGFWENPDSFDPDRFLPENVARRHKFAYQAFAAGPRICIGAALATLETKIMLALALRKFRIVRPTNVPVMQARFGTTHAKGGIWLELAAR
ncbi:MAG TPA: cytochrome P450 [Polyangiaceae bacterium]